MGNHSSKRENPEEFPKAFTFYTRLRIIWIEFVVKRLKDQSRLQLDLYDINRLHWQDYFTVFKDIKSAINSEYQSAVKKAWHPAVVGYDMIKVVPDGDINENIIPRDGSILDDDFTNDESSDSNDDEQDCDKPPKPSPASKESISRNLDPSYTNPIFFFYSAAKEKAELEGKKSASERSSLERERRALANAINTRSAKIDALEKKALQQGNARQRKLDEMRVAYLDRRQKREADYRASISQLQGGLLRLVEEQKEKEDVDLEAGYKKEYGELFAKHSEKNEEEARKLREKREELNVFKDLELQESPTAEKLEKFAKLEIYRCDDELRNAMGQLTRLQAEFETIKTQYDAHSLHTDGARSKQADKKALEIRSMVNVAETRLKEAQIAMAQCMNNLLDANCLLVKAVREKKLQEELLPLFELTRIVESSSPCCNASELVLAAIILSLGSFDEKFNFMLSYFRPNSNSLDVSFVLVLGRSLAKVFQAVDLVPATANTADIDALLLRIFSSHGLTPGKDNLTDYEVKSIFRHALSRSEALMKMFQIKTSLLPIEGSYSTYQLDQIQPLIAFTLNTVDFASCLDRLHYLQSREKTTLSAVSMRSVHDLAMAMGLGDPFVTDYSKFFVKAEKKSSYRVEALNNGLLTNVNYFEINKRENAVIKIQSLIRQFLDKKLSERATKQLALLEARAAAVKELKARILREYQKREASRGVGKMKWDAEVRMRQAKLRTLGQAVSRSDVVMLMVEEAISIANRAIDQKFEDLRFEKDMKTLKLIQPKEGNGTISFSPDLFSLRDETLIPIKITDLSSGQFINQNTDLSAAPETSVEASEKDPEPESEEQPKSSLANEVDQLHDQLLNLVKVKTPIADQIQTHIASTTSRAQINDEQQAREKGESMMVSQLRRVLSSAEVTDIVYLYRRLRLLDSSLTEFKVKELLAEMPSKRLLLKYVAKNELEYIRQDLGSHFKLQRSQEYIAQQLRNIESSDFEFGFLRKYLYEVQQETEVGILKLHKNKLAKKVLQFREAMELRRDSKADGASVESFAMQELDGLTSTFSQHIQNYSSLVDTLKIQRDKLTQMALSLEYSEQKVVIVKEFANFRSFLGQTVPVQARYDWTQRYYDATDAIAKETASKLPLLKEISSLVSEFLEVAKNDACQIIREFYLPEHMQTIPKYSSHNVAGRSRQSGRGVEGSKSWYYAHNIFYLVGLDYDGVYNGSDDFAAKCLSQERLASLEYLCSNVDRLRVPLISTVDYFGYRVLAVSQLPIKHIIFDEKGEVQRVFEDLLHGMLNKGESFINRSKLADKLLKIASVKLNLAEHGVAGLCDISSTKTHTTGLLKVYRGSDEKFYARKFCSVFPCELPDLSYHFTETPRQQSIFWRRLRPELVKTSKKTLSSDNLTLLNKATLDAAFHLANLKDFTQHYFTEVVGSYVKFLLTRKYHIPLSEGFGIDFAEEMHQRGINLRHLGLMRHLIWRVLPGKASVFNGEKFIRTTNNLSLEVRDGQSLTIDGKVFTIQSTRRNPIMTTRLPISQKFRDDSIINSSVCCGDISSDKNCDEIRLLILAEMVARCVKYCIRFQLRSYNEKNKIVSLEFYRRLLAQHLNLITGSADNSLYFEEVLFEALRERFGPLAITISERKGMQNKLQPVLHYIVKRVQDMFDIKFTASSMSSFSQSSGGFRFSALDIVEVRPRIRHNIVYYNFSEAMLLVAEADKVKDKSFIAEVLRDNPSVFFTLSERKGSRLAANSGVLASQFNAKIAKGCELEQPGPIKADRFVRAVSFHPANLSTIDCNHHEQIVPTTLYDHFTVAFFVRCLGGKDLNRTILESGRYKFAVGRDGVLSFSFFEGVHTINLRCCLVESTVWHHIVGSYDGTLLRCYVNSHLIVEMEVGPILAQKEAVLKKHHEEKLRDILQDEVEERAKLKEKTLKDAAIFFQTKEGISTLKRISQRLVDVDSFSPEGGLDNSEPLTGKQKRALILKRAKDEYLEDLFTKNRQDLATRFQQLLSEEDNNFHRIVQNGRLNIYRPLRLGASLPDANNREGSDYFYGHLTCVSVYARCLSTDRIQAQYFSYKRNSNYDSQRLYAKAASKFLSAYSKDCLSGVLDSGTETEFLTAYARSLSQSLSLDPEIRKKSDTDSAKVYLVNLLSVLKARRLLDVIASFIKGIPRDPEFADLLVESTLSLKELHPHYLSSSLILSREYLAFLPFELGLITSYRPSRFYEAAAFIFQEVVRDHNFSFIYGEVDLSWLGELSSSLLVVSIVKSTFEDKQLKVVKILDLLDLQQIPNQAFLPSDYDIMVLVQNYPLLEGFDLHDCASLTNGSFDFMNRIDFIKVLDLSGCVQITNEGLTRLGHVFPKLERLSLSGVSQLSDDGLELVAKNCSQLVFLNLNDCCQVTVVPLLLICEQNRFLTNLQISKIHLTDQGMVELADIFCKRQILELNVSHCSALTDIGVAAIADSCASIRRLSLAGINRATYRSIQQITTRCWDLSYLDIQDIFLTTDLIFIYDPVCDGRAAANEKMLRSMKSLKLSNCLALTDNGIRGLAERCRNIENLSLQGCSKLTDRALDHLADDLLCSSSKFSMSATFMSLNVSFCTALSPKGIKTLLSKCQCLSDLDLSGLVTMVDDNCMKMISSACPTLQSLRLRQCLQVSDLSLCYVVESLWLECLDISGCHSITDKGIEVLAGACTGLQFLYMNNLKLTTVTSVKFVEQNCRALRLLECQDCPNITVQDLDLTKWNFKILL